MAKHSKFKQRMEFMLLKMFYCYITKFPKKMVAKSLDSIALNIGFRVGVRKKLVIAQITRAFPEYSAEKVLDVTKRMYLNMSKMIYEIFVIDKEELVKSITIQGEENLLEAETLTNGVLLATGHYGNWELLGFFLLHRGIKISAIFKRLSNPYMNSFFKDFRDGFGLDSIYKKNALRGIIKALRDNRMIFFIHDQDGRKAGKVMPFLGSDASVFMGLAKISIKTKTPILPLYHIRTPEGKHIIRFEKLIYPQQEDNDDVRIMKKVNSSLEQVIKEYPELWFWLHKRWKSVDKKRGVKLG